MACGHAHHAFRAFFERGGAQARSWESAGVDAIPERRLKLLAQGPGGIGTRKTVIERNARVLRADQEMFFGRQFHRIDDTLY